MLRCVGCPRPRVKTTAAARTRLPRRLLCCLFALACAGGVARAQSFGPVVGYTVGSNPHSVALGDFNGDGKLDAVTANNGSANVSVLLNDGNGTFRPAVNYAANRNTKAVAVADFNRDGALDIAAANANFADAVNETVSVLLGNGDGTFRPKADYRVDSLALSVAAGDFNDDSNPDLVTSNGDHSISVLVGKGDGTFQPFVNYEAGYSFTGSVVVGEFNGDGKQDVAVACGGLGRIDPNVAVALGNGDGTFQNPVSYAAGPGAPTTVAAGDFNGDGKADLAAGNTLGNTVSLLVGNGDGTFQPKRNFTVASSPISVATADPDGDGKLDLLVANEVDFQLLTGNGDGTFAAAKTYPTLGAGEYAITSGDLDGDGRPEVVTTRASGGSLGVFVNQSGALQIGGVVLDDETGAPVAGVTMTLGGTGVITASTTTAADGSYAFKSLAAGASYSVAPTRANYTFAPASLSFESLSADQRADFTATLLRYAIVGRVRDASAAGVGGVTVALTGSAGATATTAADGTFSFASLPGGGAYTVTPSLAGHVFNPAARATTNLTGDARADFIASLQTFAINGTVRDADTGVGIQGARLILSGSASQTTSVSSQFGNYTFNNLSPGGSYTVTAAQTDRAFTDFILLAPLSRSFDNLTSIQTAHFLGRRLNYAVGVFTRGIATADFDADGKADVAATVSNSNSLKILLGNGDGTLRPPVSYAAGSSPTAVTAADFNGDGKPDAAVVNALSGDVSVLIGNGDGTFNGKVDYPTGTTPRFVAAGDLDGDGRPDLVVSSNSFLNVLVNNGDGTFRPKVDYLIGGLSGHVTLGDYNGDGRLDVIASHRVLLGNGDGTLRLLEQTAEFVVSAAADFNGDGILDVATVPEGRTVTALGNGDGTFRSVGTVFLEANPTFIRAGEFNGDGRVDLLAVAGLHINLLLGNGDGTFQNRSGYFVSGPQHLAVADFNNDGRQDFAYANMDSSPETDERGRVFVMLNQVRTGLQFRVSRYTAREADGRALVEVTRSGDLQTESSVSYQTSDSTLAIFPCGDTSVRRGEAVSRCDYALTIDTLTFAPGETTKTIAIPLVDDAHPEPPETFQVFLHTPAGGTLSNMVAATITIEDNDPAPGPNPVSESAFFVRQQYLDFLSREPEPDGLAAWLRVLNNCPDVNNDSSCDRVTVSGSFFRSHEFQLKGFFVLRFYAVTYNRLPQYSEIVADMRSITGATAEDVHRKRAAFAERWTQDALFAAAFNPMGNSTYVNFLMNRYNLQRVTTPDPLAPEGEAKVTLTRADLAARLDDSSLTRAQVLRAVVESDEVAAAEFNRAFVAMQYFGYLRRNPETAGFNNWLNYLNAHPTDFRTMVNGFVNSVEYRLRFGQP